MKKFIYSFLITLFIFVNLNFIISNASPNTFKEGVYKLSDFNPAPDNKYFIQNISNENIYVIVFNENQVGIQAFQLPPRSDKYNLAPLKADYRLVIVGNGEVYLS
ncbi:hypothetical protein [Clostridium intestinale]|uniref:hypothetical protein n=1 Tax=Clostridium intestinale TaxID=36845 RepID=UPI002DD6A86F|nr:hypothetical protein [Clostridium intestinale]WRY52269.1 hypothetical protein P8F83_03530 [Clostridium intestinale]